jgi:exodeoxyribonuclease VII large subunit
VNGPERAVIGVAELDRRLRHAVEGASSADWVQGEISAFRRVASGHCYFTLKDEVEDAILECVVYRFQAQRLARHFSEGARIQLFGKATVWAPRGRLQFVVDAARPVGRGALLEALEQLKAKLLAEGLFAASRKRPLPSSPRVVGVVTSGHGAAWHDIRTIALRRAPVTLVLAPALVQGEGAVESMLRAIDLVERYPGIEAIILGRGGGSLEDLFAFNDERLVRRIAACTVPVVSAVGHEVDTSLSDLVADARAATPSEAAELLIGDHAAQLRKLAQLTVALGRAMRDHLRENQSALTAARVKLSDPRFVIAQKQQLVDEFALTLERRFRRLVATHREQLGGMQQRLAVRHPRAVVMSARLRLTPIEARLAHAIRLRLSYRGRQVETAAARLDGLSPLAVLGRGYAIALTRTGEALRRTSQVHLGDPVTLRVERGSLQLQVTGVEEPE